jgi:hypothetical protein
MPETKVLDFTKAATICGDLTVYILDEFESDPQLRELKVIHDNREEVEEAAKSLQEFGFTVEIREENGKIVAIFRRG